MYRKDRAGHENKKKVRLLAGTIAQMAIMRNDPVGLVIGNGETYIKPSYDRARLYQITYKGGEHFFCRFRNTVPLCHDRGRCGHI